MGCFANGDHSLMLLANCSDGAASHRYEDVGASVDSTCSRSRCRARLDHRLHFWHAARRPGVASAEDGDRRFEVGARVPEFERQEWAAYQNCLCEQGPVNNAVSNYMTWA